MQKTLKEHLENWTEFDYAQFSLGVVLGLWPNTPKAFTENKWVFWTDNQIGNMLYGILEKMVKENILESNSDGYRWKNENFKRNGK